MSAVLIYVTFVWDPRTPAGSIFKSTAKRVTGIAGYSDDGNRELDTMFGQAQPQAHELLPDCRPKWQ